MQEILHSGRRSWSAMRRPRHGGFQRTSRPLSFRSSDGRQLEKPEEGPQFLRTIEKNVPAGLQIHLILDYLAAHNDEPTPLVWTATADGILEKVARGRATLRPLNQN